MIRTVVAAVVCCLAPVVASQAQLATIGVGALLSERSPEPVFEVHLASAPLHRVRAYATVSWTDDSFTPAVITAGERQLLGSAAVNVGLGAGFLWLNSNGYDAYPIIVSSAVVPLRIPRMALVAIGSTQPFQDFAWSVILKASVAVWFAR